MDLVDKYKNTLEEIQNIPEVLSVIIFGSYSIGKIKKNSDLDIAIIFKKNIFLNQKQEILSNGNDELDLNDFYSMPLSLQYKIINFGKIYYTKINLFNIKKEITHEWFDFKPILNRIYESKNLLSII